MDALADPARARGTIRRIAEELGVHPEALRTWVRKAQVDGGLRPGTTTDEAQRVKELEKEVRGLRGADALLDSASACLSRRSLSARPADLPVHRLPQEGVRGLDGPRHAQRGRSQDRPEHVTHARRSLPPGARSLRDEALKAETPRVRKNQLLGAGGPQDARDAGPTRDCRASRCRSRGPLYRPCGSWVSWACAVSDAPGRPERRARRLRTSARPTSSKGVSTRSGRTSCGSPTFPRKREVPPPVYAPSRGGSVWLSSPTCTRGGSSAGRPPAGQCAPTWPWTPSRWPSGSGNAPGLVSLAWCITCDRGARYRSRPLRAGPVRGRGGRLGGVEGGLL